MTTAWAPPSKPGDVDKLIPKAKQKLSGNSYGKVIGDDRTETYTTAFGEALRQYQNNVHMLVVTGRREGPDVKVDGVFGWSTKKQMGFLGDTGTPPNVPPRSFYSFTGTWGAWNNGFSFDVGVRIDQAKYQHQGLGYNTNAFMIGNDPSHSYIDMLNDGERAFWEFGRKDFRPKVLSGYSGGAGVVVQTLRNWPMDRRKEIIGVVQFGDPNRPPGRTLLGNDPGGHGISEDFPPDWVLDRYYSFTIDGDMYPNAVGLLPIFYDILTRMEATAEFAMYLFNLFVNSATGALTTIGAQALGVSGQGIPFAGQLAGLLPLITGGGLFGAKPAAGQQINLLAMITNIPAIIISLQTALKFLITGAHSHYGDQPLFDGLTAVDRAVKIVNNL